MKRARKALVKTSVRRRTLAGYQATRLDVPPRRIGVRPDFANPA